MPPPWIPCFVLKRIQVSLLVRNSGSPSRRWWASVISSLSPPSTGAMSTTRHGMPYMLRRWQQPPCPRHRPWWFRVTSIRHSSSGISVCPARVFSRFASRGSRVTMRKPSPSAARAVSSAWVSTAPDSGSTRTWNSRWVLTNIFWSIMIISKWAPKKSPLRIFWTSGNHFEPMIPVILSNNSRRLNCSSVPFAHQS